MTALDAITVDVESLTQPTDLRGLFSQPGPIELEIGCGKGTFLLRQAKAHPDRNFLGIEWANKIYLYAADRMARWGLKNVRVMRADAKHFVIHRLEADSLDALHIYHPDPWPKKRHHRRRLIQPDFIAAAIRALKPGARLAIQTDHAEYFEQIREVTGSFPQLQKTDWADENYGIVGEDIKTNFEIKYEREGRDFHRLAFRCEKRAD
ncbi:MAG: tRNA (guanosine(46)-N7)-methyltransferase TrmB [Phycisphaerales bacterium]|nr:tRNA (guanosine(46)-N7)-methyltransferase TrmB [Phycisphaerales bacterium]MCB9857377.1 tRNA (guanosine(46)-N7)-methyltransferase TrmB [Phycisphaerales bacterium]